MFDSRKLAIAVVFVLAGMVQPALAQTTLHVFLWDAGADMDMVDGHKIGDGANRLDDTMGIAVNANEVPAGAVTFQALNTSADTEHEMVVSRLSGPDGTLPFKADISRVDESAIGSEGEVEELEPGNSGQLTVNLEPGTYVLYCNIPGHYAAGMWMKITVQ